MSEKVEPTWEMVNDAYRDVEYWEYQYNKVCGERDALQARVRELEADNARMILEIEDWREQQRRVMDERCGDERHCTCVPELRHEVITLREWKRRAVAVMKLSEWIDNGYAEKFHDCHVCWNMRTEGHRPGCKLAALLKEAGGESESHEKTA